MNHILGERVAITTPKPQTTRDRIRGVHTREDWQAIYVDTPGIHEAQSALHRYMVQLAVATIADADLVYLLVDVDRLAQREEKVLAQTRAICERLAQSSTPVFLVLNKVDRLARKEQLLPVIETLSGYHTFAEIFPISALKGVGVAELEQATRPLLPEGPALFPEDSLTDRPMRFLAAEYIREQLYMKLNEELPYHVAVGIDRWKERADGLVSVHATIYVSRKGHKSIVIGRGGSMIRDVGSSARVRLERFLDRRVFLDLHVRVEKNWTDRESALRKLGYTERV